MTAFDDAAQPATEEAPSPPAAPDAPGAQVPATRTARGAGPTAEAPSDGAGRLTVAPASEAEWRQVVEWAAAEEWNPGLGDLGCFHPTDPGGFFVGRLDGRLVSAVSVVTYSESFAFLGYYLVHPGHRRQGLGLATWRAAVPHAGTRTIGLDAVPAQQDVYRRSGFVPAYQTVRYAGRPAGSGAPATTAVPVGPAHLDAIADYDQRCFPAPRPAFVSRWLTAAGHRAHVCLTDGEVTGYGAIRPGRSGWRVGPLFADTDREAEALFDALTAGLGPDEQVWMDVPEPHTAARAIVEARGLTPDSHTTRMYAGPAPDVPLGRTYGVTSLELG